MSDKIIQTAFKEAEKDLEEKKVNRIKEIVKNILEKIEILKKDKQKIERQILIHKRDIDDMKTGRLDMIFERQEKDEEANKISLIKVEKIDDKDYSLRAPLTNDYMITSPLWNYSTTGNVIVNGFTTTSFTCGTYLTSNGHAIYLYSNKRF